MKKLLITTISIAATVGIAYRAIDNTATVATNIYKTQVEAVAPITECYSLKLNRETGEKIKKTYAC
jgi:hypothetical protein